MFHSYRQIVPYLISALLFWGAFQWFLSSYEVRFPGTDVFLFKEAGVNLATKGKFVVANLPHMPPDLEMPYAYYPPVYPFLFGVWSKAFGVGLSQSILYDSLLRLLRTLALGLLVLLINPLLLRYRRLLPALVGILLVLSLLSTDGDRPEELACLFGFLSWALCLMATRKPVCGFFSSIFLGLCGATSPAGGVYFAMGVVALAWKSPWQRSLLTVGRYGFVALITFLSCTLPVYFSDPLAFSRFSSQLPLSTFPYKLPWVGGRSFLDFIHSFWKALSFSLDVGLPYWYTSLLLFAFTLICGSLKHPVTRKILLFSCVYLISCVFIWTLQPFYLWYLAMGLISVLLVRFKSQPLLPFCFALSFAFFPMIFREAKAGWFAWQRPSSETSSAIRSRILPLLSEGARLATTPEQYFTFRPYTEISHQGYVCDRLNHYDFLYVSPNSRHLSQVGSTDILCSDKRGCFEQREDFVSRGTLSFLGESLPIMAQGFGGMLYENRHCLPNHLPVSDRKADLMRLKNEGLGATHANLEPSLVNRVELVSP